ncbi:MAG TPA: hypothetical protein VNS46_04835 [Nocardioides sp.]|nr:hypothetical protein [Nocardioides sp.]
MSFFDHQALPSAPAPAPSTLPARLQIRLWGGLFALLLLAVVIGSALLF